MGVPDTLVGCSAFAFNKLVRYIARHRLGSVKLDIKNSFFQLLNRQKPLPPIMAEYLDHREEKLAQIGRAKQNERMGFWVTYSVSHLPSHVNRRRACARKTLSNPCCLERTSDAQPLLSSDASMPEASAVSTSCSGRSIGRGHGRMGI